MQMILSIDPGIDTGWALYEQGILVDCGLGTASNVQSLPLAISDRKIEEVILEIPEIYTHASNGKKVNPNDLITLALVAGRYIERYKASNRPVFVVLPHRWKGNVPKKIHNQRILAKLDMLTRRKVGTDHNIIDAVGLNLWWQKISSISKQAYLYKG